jgi:glycosidase
MEFFHSLEKNLGIHEKLDYLQNTVKSKAIYVNPIYSSGGQDTGYDITNHTQLDPVFGNMETFGKLVHAMHKKDMKLIMDFVPNHSSRDHPWFNSSRNLVEGYADYYVWHPGKGGNPPNNWVCLITLLSCLCIDCSCSLQLSVFGGSAWEFDDVREEYYLHQFSANQPDLNLRSDAVKEELKACA